MNKLTEKNFTGERALFQSSALKLEYCSFEDGESPLKESRNIELYQCDFKWKYPLWYCKEIQVKNSALFQTARSGIWYTNEIELENVIIDAPKTFRRCNHIKLQKVEMTYALETLWNCKMVRMNQVTAKGDYFAMGCEDVEVDDLTLSGNYCFDGAKNLVIRNSRLLSKDAFWNCENVTVYDSYIHGEYLGWNSKNVTFVNCVIESTQGLCYMDHVILKNCRLRNTTLAFEYSTIQADVIGTIESVKNPISGILRADKIQEVIFDNSKMNKEDTKIEECK